MALIGSLAGVVWPSGILSKSRGHAKGSARKLAEHGRTRMNSPRTYQDAPDTDLLGWSASGDRRAFDAIVTRHGPLALRVAARLIGDPVMAQKVAQEAMVRAWSQASRFDPRRAIFTTWLYRIVVNLCIDQRRRVQPEPIPDDFDLAFDAGEASEIKERRTALAEALGELPIRQRAAMTLVYDEGLSGTEAARILGSSTKAVERLLARARVHLRERLRPSYDWKESWRC
jgi:RNA polymerase sigma-70 factor (ECF subfamily)